MENGNLPAFARPWSKIKQSPDAPEQISLAQPGLTKREYFAAMAMQGILAQHEPGVYEPISTHMTIQSALSLADELLKQLDNE